MQERETFVACTGKVEMLVICVPCFQKYKSSLIETKYVKLI